VHVVARDDDFVEKRVVTRRVAGLAQVRGVKLVLIRDEDAAVLEVGEVRLQRRGVHDDEGVDRIAGRVDVMAGEVKLKAGDAGESARGGANFGREVGEGADVVAEGGRGVGHLSADHLHPVAGVAAEADDCRFEMLQLLLRRPRHALAGLRGAGTHRLISDREKTGSACPQIIAGPREGERTSRKFNIATPGDRAGEPRRCSLRPSP